MSRVFWVAVGAVGGIVAYRKGTQAATRARELGPLGTAQVTAQAASRLAGRTAHGLGRLNDLKARRDGRLVIGSAEMVDGAAPETAWMQDAGSGTAPADRHPVGAPGARPGAAGNGSGRSPGSGPASG